MPAHRQIAKMPKPNVLMAKIDVNINAGDSGIPIIDIGEYHYEIHINSVNGYRVCSKYLKKYDEPVFNIFEGALAFIRSEIRQMYHAGSKLEVTCGLDPQWSFDHSISVQYKYIDLMQQWFRQLKKELENNGR